MYAKQINTGIALYGSLPSKYRSETLNVAGGFHLLEASVHKAEGFYPVVTPSFDNTTHKLSDIYFDESNEVFTYNVIARSADEMLLDSWHAPEFSMRIITPKALAMSAEGAQILTWWQLEGLTYTTEGNLLYLYCNMIQSDHQGLFAAMQEQYAGLITIETIPAVE